MSEPVLQSSLGEVTSVKTQKDRNWNMGYLALGKVIRVHPKRYTADVQVLKASNTIMSAKDQEGRHACRIGVSNAGYSEKYKKPYGEIVPIQKGSIVLVGFLKNSKEKPVILRVFHDIGEELGESNYKNILNSAYASESDDSIDNYVNITPIQDFFRLDDEGNFEIGSHTKSFLVGKERAMDDESFDFEDLQTKTSGQETVGVDEKYTTPKKYMAVFRDKFSDSLTNWLRIIVDAAKTSFRLAKLQQSENKSTYLEIDQDGAIRLRRQLDTKSFEGSKEYSEICIGADGVFTFTSQKDKDSSTQLQIQNGETFSITQSSGDNSTKITSTSGKQLQVALSGGNPTTLTFNSDGSGVTVETNEPMKLKTDKDITVSGKNIGIKSEKSTVTTNDATVTTTSATLNASTVGVTSGTVNVSASTTVQGSLSIMGSGTLNGRPIACIGDPVQAGPYTGAIIGG